MGLLTQPEPVTVSGGRPERDDRVSVVVPTHLRADLIGRALDSVLRQTVLPSEILVVDDAGDARTERTVGDHRGTGQINVRYVRNPVANGPSGSRNLGAARAVGSVIAFLDDDDVWEPRYLEQAIGLLHDADVVLTPIQSRWFDATGRETFRRVRPLDVSRSSEQIIGRNPGVTGSNMVVDRRVFHRCGGYDEHLWIAEDNEFLARLVGSGARIRVADVTLVTQLVHAGDRLSRGGQRRADGYRNLLRKTYGAVSPATRRRLALQYFSARKDAARDARTRWRYRLYAWSLAQPRDFMLRAQLRAAARAGARVRLTVRSR